MLSKLNTVRKALAGGVSAAIAAGALLINDGLTRDEWLQIAGALVVGFLGVFFAPANKTKPTPPVDPERGDVGVGELLLIVAVILLVLLSLGALPR